MVTGGRGVGDGLGTAVAVGAGGWVGVGLAAGGAGTAGVGLGRVAVGAGAGGAGVPRVPTGLGGGVGSVGAGEAVGVRVGFCLPVGPTLSVRVITREPSRNSPTTAAVRTRLSCWPGRRIGRRASV